GARAGLPRPPHHRPAGRGARPALFQLQGMRAALSGRPTCRSACFSVAAADGRPMLLIIDNYDSFTYNLVQYFGEMGAQMEIRRNDQVTLDEIRQLRPDHICVSPGPCTPKEAGISCDVIRTFG